MLVVITQNFDTGTRRYYPGDNPDVDPATARQWVADGKATYDTDGRSDRFARNSGVGSGVVTLSAAQPLFVPIRGFLSTSANWKNYGSTQQPAQVNLNGGNLQLRGRLNLSSGNAATGNIADLPNGFNTGSFTEAAQGSLLPTSTTQDFAAITIAPAGVAAATPLPAFPTVQASVVGTPAVFVLDINSQYKAGGLVKAAVYQRNAAVADDVAVLFPDAALPIGSRLKVAFFFHGASDDYLSHITSPVSATSSQRLAANLINALLTDGWTIISSSGGAITDHWGNPASWAATQEALSWLRANFIVDKVTAIGQSMGGLSSLRALAYDGSITNWAGIYPVCGLQAIYDGGSYTANINTAHGGAPAFTANVGACDPLQFPTALFAGKKMLTYHSAGDTAVPKAGHSDALATKVTGTAANISVVATTGNHGDTSNWSTTVANAIVAHLNS